MKGFRIKIKEVECFLYSLGYLPPFEYHDGIENISKNEAIKLLNDDEDVNVVAVKNGEQKVISIDCNAVKFHLEEVDKDEDCLDLSKQWRIFLHNVIGQDYDNYIHEKYIVKKQKLEKSSDEKFLKLMKKLEENENQRQQSLKFYNEVLEDVNNDLTM